MATSGESTGWGKVFDWVGGVRAKDPAVRHVIFGYTLDSRAAVIAATICSMVLWICAIVLTTWNWPVYFAAFDLALGVARWLVITSPWTVDQKDRSGAVGVLMLLGLAWGLMLGIGVTLFMRAENHTLTLLGVSVIAGTIGVATFRNASVPRHAILLILAITAPVFVTMTGSGKDEYELLALCLIPWALSLFAMVRQNYRVIESGATAKVQLHRTARIDTMTGLWNRYRFGEYVREQAGREANGLDPLAVIYLDIDEFRRVNVKYGPQVGDLVLVQVAERIRSALRETDPLFRLGGDEFAVVIGNHAPDTLASVVDHLREALAPPLKVRSNLSLEIAFSMSSAGEYAEPEAIRSLVAAADFALREAKAMGRGQYIHDRRRQLG